MGADRQHQVAMLLLLLFLLLLCLSLVILNVMCDSISFMTTQSPFMLLSLRGTSAYQRYVKGELFGESGSDSSDQE